MLSALPVTNFIKKVNRTDGKHKILNYKLQTIKGKKKMEPVKDIPCFLVPWLASTLPHSDLHHQLLPHHHIPPLDWASHQDHGFYSTTVAFSHFPPQGHLHPSPHLTPLLLLPPYPSCPSHLLIAPHQIQPTLCHLYQIQWKNSQYCNQQLGCGKGQQQQQHRWRRQQYVTAEAKCYGTGGGPKEQGGCDNYGHKDNRTWMLLSGWGREKLVEL